MPVDESWAKIYYVRFDGAVPGLVGQRVDSGDSGQQLAPVLDDTEHEINTPVLRNGVQPKRQAMGETFTVAEVARLFDVSESRLRYWARSDFITPSIRDGGKRRYSFSDLVSIRSAVTLLEKGVSLQRVRRLLAVLQDKMPKVSHPLGCLRIMGDEKTIVVTDDDHEFEADSGQLLIDFSVENIEQDVVQKLPPRDPEQPMSAFDWYLEGCRFDEDESTYGKAEEAYYKAIHLDPTMANAYTNLGNLLFRTGAVDDARALYEKAIEVDPSQAEGHYNLGFLDFENGFTEKARRRFAAAAELDTTFADAHYNLAMVLFRLGKDDDAHEHLKTYLDLEPGGPWAELARQKLGIS